MLEKDPLRRKPYTHAGWYGAVHETMLAGGADTDAGRLREFGADWNIASEHLYSDYRELLEAERPDIVSVCAYAPERAAMVLDSVAAGVRGLWVEKAVATSLGEADAMEQALRAAGAAAIVHFPRRSNGTYRLVRRLVAEERYGRLLTVQAAFSGDLLHTGTHAYDILRFWCGEVAELRGWTEEPVRGDRLADCGGTGHFVFENGTQAFLSGQKRKYFTFRFDLHFERARL